MIWSSSCCQFLSSTVQASNFKVIGHIGQNVTLPCRYDKKTHGLLGFCWGQGKVPTFKCSNTILYSSDGTIISRDLRDPRYQLLGRVTDGDVSLTILNAQWSDTGVYGCRVEIPGMFNDYKVNTYLVMEEGKVHADWSGYVWSLCSFVLFFIFISLYQIFCCWQLLWNKLLPRSTNLLLQGYKVSIEMGMNK